MKRIYWLAIALSLFSIAAFLGFRMTELDIEKQLWGWLPFGFHLSLWLGILGMAAWLRPRAPQVRRLGLAVLSGVLASAGFVPFPFVPALWVAWVPLLAIHYERRAEAKAGIGLGHLYVAFYTWNLCTTWWVSNSALAAGFFAMGVNSFFQCLPWLLATRLGRKLPYWAEALLIGCAWMAFEWGHLRWDLTWPWLTFGNAFAHVPWMVQWYEWTGVPGGTAWILSLNFLFYAFWKKNDFSFFPKKENRKACLLLSAKILLPLMVSLAIGQWRSAHPGAGPVQYVATVQPNYEPHYEKFRVSDRSSYRRLLELTARAMAEGPVDYVLFPETSFNDDLREHNLRANREIRDLDSFAAARPGMKFVLGVSSARYFSPGEPHTVYTVCNRSRSVCLEAHNSAIQLCAGQPEIPVYVKSKLVPGPETFPFAGLLGGIKPLTQLVDHLGGTLSGMGRQAEREVFWSPEGDFAVAPVICYESVFGEYVTEYVQRGAQAIFVLTNDGWWDNTPGHVQHLHFARLRAIETRRPVVRSANTGISAHIDDLGNVLTSVPYGQTGCVRAPIRGGTGLTWYVRWGDWVSRLALLALPLLCGWGLYAMVLGRRSPQSSSGSGAASQ
jgi:apolipoprotein N-acyltransferase